MEKEPFHLGGQHFSSRLIMGTGKFASSDILKHVLAASGSEIVTVAVRRVDIDAEQDPFMRIISPERFLFLPNTSGARNAEEAVRLAEIARFSGVSDWVKLEISPEHNHLMPDPIETLKAAEILVQKGFKVMPYIHADPVLAKRLEEAGCVSVMPLGSPIGTNMGLETKAFLKIIIEQSNIPVIVDAGIGAPSHACEAMELGADAVLVNTAIATAKHPIHMAEAFRLAVEAGRLAYLSGLGAVSASAQASSPLTGFLRV
jgi:thiazole synthase